MVGAGLMGANELTVVAILAFLLALALWRALLPRKGPRAGK